MSDELEKMSINVYTNQKESILKSDNSCNDYILKMNEEYNNCNIQMRLKIKELRNINDDLESDNDKQDSSIRYMRGMMKNYIELVQLYKYIVTKKDDLRKIDNKELKRYDNYCHDLLDVTTFSFFFYLFNSVVFLYLDMLSIMDIVQNTINICICLVSSSYFYNMGRYDNLFLRDFNIVHNIVDSIKEDVAKIKQIESSSDFLDEFIDNI
jgi:hypothetical protein